MVGEWYVKSRHLQGYNPHLCWLRTDGLASTSKYWTYRSHAGVMGPVSLVASCQSKLAFSQLPHWLLWERSWVWTRRSDGHRVVDCSQTEQGKTQPTRHTLPTKSVDDFMKGCYALTTWDTYGRWPYADWAWEACDVLVGFFPTWCTSIRIAATLGYEYHLFATVIT
jgi:hypothetical protein